MKNKLLLIIAFTFPIGIFGYKGNGQGIADNAINTNNAFEIEAMDLAIPFGPSTALKIVIVGN